MTSVPMYWHRPPGPLLVVCGRNREIQRCEEILEGALCLALDAEWPPGERPRATLVQLAAWAPDTGTTIVLLVSSAPPASHSPGTTHNAKLARDNDVLSILICLTCYTIS
jgi:hypothetical protein